MMRCLPLQTGASLPASGCWPWLQLTCAARPPHKQSVQVPLATVVHAAAPQLALVTPPHPPPGPAGASTCPCAAGPTRSTCLSPPHWCASSCSLACLLRMVACHASAGRSCGVPGEAAGVAEDWGAERAAAWLRCRQQARASPALQLLPMHCIWRPATHTRVRAPPRLHGCIAADSSWMCCPVPAPQVCHPRAQSA